MAKRILIIDDEPDLCRTFAQYLNEVGYEAYYAIAGYEGLQKIEEISPHLILLDIRMPGMDGLEVMRQIIRKYSNVVVIIITGAPDKDIAQMAIEYGAADFVVKPIQLDKFVANTIRPILGE